MRDARLARQALVDLCLRYLSESALELPEVVRLAQAAAPVDGEYDRPFDVQAMLTWIGALGEPGTDIVNMPSVRGCGLTLRLTSQAPHPELGVDPGAEAQEVRQQRCTCH